MKTQSHMRRAIGALAAFRSLGIALCAGAAVSSADPASLADDKRLVKRGEFLVHNVVLCIDCHSPRGETGEFIPDLHLRGASIPFAPIVPMPAWAPAAPPIAGLPAGWSEDAMRRFLMTGVRPNGLPETRPPMPPYRLEQADAEAVVAYLRSLGQAATKVVEK